MLNALLNGNLPTPPEQQERGTNSNNTTRSNPDIGQATPGGGDGTRVGGRYRQPIMFMGSFGSDGGLRFQSVQSDQQSTMPGSFQSSQNTTYQRTESPRPAENRDMRTANMIK